MNVQETECGCLVGKGPFASCKHVAALSYALEEFSRFGRVQEFLTSTEKLQEWNQPRPKKLEIIPVAELSSRRGEILKEKKTISCYIGIMIHYSLSVDRIILETCGW